MEPETAMCVVGNFVRDIEITLAESSGLEIRQRPEIEFIEPYVGRDGQAVVRAAGANESLTKGP